MKNSPLFVAGLLLGMAALPLTSHAQTQATAPMTPMTTLAPMDQLFAGRAAEGNLAEINLAQLALRKSKNDGVKMVAQTIIKGHSQAQAELTGLAPSKGVMIPSMVSPAHMAIMEKLEKAKGDAFDKMYISVQLDDHENTIALFANEMSMGQDDALKTFATKYLPDIVGHTVMIYNVARQIKAPGIEMRPMTPPTPPGVTITPMDSM